MTRRGISDVNSSLYDGHNKKAMMAVLAPEHIVVFSDGTSAPT